MIARLKSYLRNSLIVSGILLLSLQSFAQNSNQAPTPQQKDLFLGAIFSTHGIQNIIQQLLANYAETSNKEGNKNNLQIKIPKQSFVQRVMPQKNEKNAGLLEGIEQLTGIKVSEGFDISINSDDMTAELMLNTDNVKIQKSKSSPDIFRFDLVLLLDAFKVNFKRIQVCTGVNCKDANSLKVELKNSSLELSLEGAPLTISSKLEVFYDIKKNVTQINVLKIKTNLENSKYRPKLDLDLKPENIVIPEIIVQINGKKFPADTTRLKKEIVSNKNYLSSMLVEKISAFITNDLVEIVNKILDEEKINSDYKYNSINNQFEVNNKIINKIDLNKYDIEAVQDNLRPEYYNRTYLIAKKGSTDLEILLNKMSSMISKIQFATIFQDLDWFSQDAALINFKPVLALNNESLKLSKEIGHGDYLKKFTPPNLSKFAMNSKNYDIVAVLSEPLINSILNVLQNTRIINETLREIAPGILLNDSGIKVHIHTDKNNDTSLYLILNLEIDLKKKNTLGYWLEKIFSNSKGKILFPFELKLKPAIMYHKNTKEYYLKLNVISPLYKDKDSGEMVLTNTFNYLPNNISNLTGIVKNGLYKDLQETLDPMINDKYGINITQLLNSKSVQFIPKGISIDPNGYIYLFTDVESIDIKKYIKESN